MNEYNEFLLIAGNERGDVKYIAPDDILYIEASGNYSYIYFTDGRRITTCRQLGVFNEMLEHWFRKSYKFFCRIGRSLIINKKYLSSFNMQRREVILYDRRSIAYWKGFEDGYKAGYDVGYNDKDGNRQPIVGTAQYTAFKRLPAPEDALRNLRAELEREVNEREVNEKKNIK